MLEIKNLTKYFGGIAAVDNCSFKIKEGKITALIGPNGAGKSTIFNLISGLLKKDSGKILFDKEDISNYTPEQISDVGISRLFQKARLFGNLTVKENLLIAANRKTTRFWKNLLGMNKFSEADADKVKVALESVGFDKSHATLTKNLSYGQQRLVEIARTMLKFHKILILDEPVGGVNPRLRNKIARLLVKLKREGETILLIEHDMEFTLKIADTVIVLDEGKVLAEGTPKQIKKNKEVLEAYLGE